MQTAMDSPCHESACGVARPTTAASHERTVQSAFEYLEEEPSSALVLVSREAGPILRSVAQQSVLRAPQAVHLGRQMLHLLLPSAAVAFYPFALPPQR